jgi:hypothetical protein
VLAIQSVPLTLARRLENENEWWTFLEGNLCLAWMEMRMNVFWKSFLHDSCDVRQAASRTLRRHATEASAHVESDGHDHAEHEQVMTANLM